MEIAERSTLLSFILVVLTLVIASPLLAQNEPPPALVGGADTVHVASPTGEKETDRASILAALEKAGPGDIIQFAPGTYLVGEIIHVTTPGILLIGHPEGTTLRGCDPSEFPRYPTDLAEMFVGVVNCNGLALAGGNQRVFDLTLEYAWHALVLGDFECKLEGGCGPISNRVRTRSGGYEIVGNTFRNTANGIRSIGEWLVPAVIRDNRFVNTFHAAVIHGSTVHFLDNDISVPNPEQVPSSGHPGGALTLSATDTNVERSLRCVGNVIAGNRVEGHPDGISIILFRPGTSCHDNVIRDNTISVARVRVPASYAFVTLTADSDSSAVGVPLALVGSMDAFGDLPVSPEETEVESRLEGNLIESNRLRGAEGLGIEIFRASRNRIIGNVITDVRRREPFPGTNVNSTDPERSGWREANGSGIWVSPGSEENEIVGNTFEGVASYAVFLEGDKNRVRLQSSQDAIRDLGSANEVTVRE